MLLSFSSLWWGIIMGHMGYDNGVFVTNCVSAHVIIVQ